MTHPLCVECGREFGTDLSPDPERCPDCAPAEGTPEPENSGPSVFVEDPHESGTEDPYDPNPDDLEPGDYEKEIK
ncbi:hypothetical protein ACFFIY_08475 [Bhargavaea ullalensis]|uniref:Rubredoxin-like domain-containing protein n=1 Tax=Bhargavaea ullalensis TaxID=1265685 RepID=A0ABV2GEE4_9BACL